MYVLDYNNTVLYPLYIERLNGETAAASRRHPIYFAAHTA